MGQKSNKVAPEVDKSRRSAAKTRAESREAANRARHMKNLELRAAGQPSPWQVACEARKARRAKDPEVAQRREEHLRRKESGGHEEALHAQISGGRP